MYIHHCYLGDDQQLKKYERLHDRVSQAVWGIIDFKENDKFTERRVAALEENWDERLKEYKSAVRVNSSI